MPAPRPARGAAAPGPAGTRPRTAQRGPRRAHGNARLGQDPSRAQALRGGRWRYQAAAIVATSATMDSTYRHQKTASATLGACPVSARRLSGWSRVRGW